MRGPIVVASALLPLLAGVELGVARPRRPVPEGGGHQTPAAIRRVPPAPRRDTVAWRSR